MKRLVKIYLDIPTEFYDEDVLSSLFEKALSRGSFGDLRPTDPRYLLAQGMVIEKVQIGAKQ